jgi:hypothetical protein
MTRLSTALTLLALLCLLAPQTAFAYPSLDWSGKAELMNGFAQEDEEDEEDEDDEYEEDEEDSDMEEDARKESEPEAEEAEAEQAAPTAASVRSNDDDDNVARNVAHGARGGLYLGIGIPVGVLGASLTIGGFASVVNASILAGIYGPGVGGIYAAAPAIGGVILLSLGIPALITGILLIRKGIEALNKISRYSLSGPDSRMARAEQNRARWGMQFAMGSVPMRR